MLPSDVRPRASEGKVVFWNLEACWNLEVCWTLEACWIMEARWTLEASSKCRWSAHNETTCSMKTTVFVLCVSSSDKKIKEIDVNELRTKDVFVVNDVQQVVF